MRLLRAIWFRLRAALQPAQINAEFDDELRYHIERETAENIKRGLSASEARRMAMAQFGGVEKFKEELRDERAMRWMSDISLDVRHGFRLLRKESLFSAAVIGTLALGIGATSTIFTIVNAVLLQSLPYPEANRIVSLSESRKGEDRGRAGQKAYRIWNESTRSFSAMALYGYTSATLTGTGEPTDINGATTSASFFSVLGARVAFGRVYTAEENLPGSAPVIVISNGMWKSQFGGDSTILNRAIMLNGTAMTVIGVMPPGFGTPWQAKYWTPLRVVETPNFERAFDVIGRLRSGVDPTSAVRELASLQPRLDSLRSAFSRGQQPVLMTLHQRMFGSVQRPLSILLAAVVILLLIACANVANLTLARAASRQREFAVRLALGAARWRVVRQLLVESSLLAGIGGLIGALMPPVLVKGFVLMSPRSVAGVTDIGVDGTVLLFTAVTTILVALAFGLIPALTGTRGTNAPSLATSSSAHAAHGRSQSVLRASLIVFEVSAALVLLTGAGLITKSFVQALAVSPGFTAQNVYAANMALPRTRYPKSPDVMAFFEAAAQRARALPGVEAVSVSAMKPLGGFSMTAELPRSPGDSTKLNVGFAEVDGQYGTAARLQLIAGRFLDDTDVKGAPSVAMISVAAAHHFFPGRDAVGLRLPTMGAYGDNAPPMLVVGVVADVAQTALDVAPVAQVFVSGAQVSMRPQYLIIRTSMGSDVLRSAIKRIVTDIDAQQPLTEFTSVLEDVKKSVAPRRFNSVLINVFAGVALLLAIIGLYGLMANAVASRRRELAIRMALGAEASRVMRLILRQGMSLVALGVLAGTALSLALSRTVSSLLFNVPANDPTIFVLAAVSLIVVALLACYIPARRATLVSPTTALRQE
ncbi:MAG: ABC transporter permease [Gemmatimonas sp.]